MENQSGHAAPAGETTLLSSLSLLPLSERTLFLRHLVPVLEPGELRSLYAELVTFMTRDFIALLPPEISLHILNYVGLNPSALARAARVSRTWYRLCTDEGLWNKICYRCRVSSWLLQHYSPSDTKMFSYRAHFARARHLYSQWRSAGSLMTSYNSSDGATVTSLTITKGKPSWTILTSTSHQNPQNGHMYIFNTASGEKIWSLNSHGAVWAASATAIEDGSALLITGGCEKMLRVWDIDSGRCLEILPGHRSTIRCVATYSVQNRIKSCSKSLDGHSKAFFALSGSRDRTIRLWSLPESSSGSFRYSPENSPPPSKSSRLLRTLSGHTDSVRCVAVYVYNRPPPTPKPSQDASDSDEDHSWVRVASGSYDRTVRIWSPVSGKCLHILRGHAHQVYTICFSPSGEWLASGSLEGGVRIWNVVDGQCRAILNGHNALVCKIQWTGDILTSAGADGRIVMFRVTTTNEQGSLFGEHTMSSSAPPSPPPTPRLASLQFEEVRSNLSDQCQSTTTLSFQHHRTLAPHCFPVSTLVLMDGFFAGISGSDDGHVRIFGVSDIGDNSHKEEAFWERELEPNFRSEITNNFQLDLLAGRLDDSLTPIPRTTIQARINLLSVGPARTKPRLDQIFQIGVSPEADRLIVAGKKAGRVMVEFWTFD